MGGRNFSVTEVNFFTPRAWDHSSRVASRRAETPCPGPDSLRERTSCAVHLVVAEVEQPHGADDLAPETATQKLPAPAGRT